ncbi:helix-turn-helix domain-containing protein [Parvibacter caecicola]|uniref:helix-turn-helix domain-containing protein n=1 Tax=Parvibacter caecicola TaxID=747645 RepID=UPI00272F80BA|nr:helix-turn-helix domain-containing protein [Parvibacter caecicola]
MNREIAERLIALRREKGLSQEGLAARLGVSRQAVSKWERAESAPDLENLVALADLYAVTVDELVRGPVATETVNVADAEVAPAVEGVAAGVVAAAAADATADEAGLEAMGARMASVADTGAAVAEGAGPEGAVAKKRPRWKMAALTAAGALVFFGVVSAMVYALALNPDTNVPFAKEMADYEPSATFPNAEYLDQYYSAEGEGSCTTRGYLSALFIDWPYGKLDVRTASAGETAGAVVIRDKSPQATTVLRWRQEGSKLVIFQARDEEGQPVAASRPDMVAPNVEVLVPESNPLFDLVQMRVADGDVAVSQIVGSRVKLQQESGSVTLSESDMLEGEIELAGGSFSMSGSANRTVDLQQTGGDSWFDFKGAAPQTMNVTLEGGNAMVGIDAAKGCSARVVQSREGEFSFLFSDAEQSYDVFNTGNLETMIQAEVSGGSLTVRDRYRMVTEGGGQPAVASEG